MSEWKKCNACKKPIGFRTKYWTCSVSTCNQHATGYVFCTVMCWDSHVPVYRHRDAWAKEHMSPSQQEAMTMQNAVTVQPVNKKPAASADDEILVVVSKVKAYIAEQAQMNTSQSVMSLLSHKVRKYCDEAIKRAQAKGRKTVMETDV